MLLVVCNMSSIRPHVCWQPSSRAANLFLSLGSCKIVSPCTCTSPPSQQARQKLDGNAQAACKIPRLHHSFHVQIRH